jgi:hypothetical protein
MMDLLNHFKAAVDYEFEETPLLKEHRFIVKNSKKAKNELVQTQHFDENTKMIRFTIFKNKKFVSYGIHPQLEGGSSHFTLETNERINYVHEMRTDQSYFIFRFLTDLILKK